MLGLSMIIVRRRAQWVMLAGLMLALVAVCGGLVANSGRSLAAEPPGGRLTDSVRTLNWHGPDYPVGTNVQDRALCNSTGLCDEYQLYVQLPSSYTVTQQVSVTVVLTWENELDDYDLYIFDPNGNTAGSSNGFMGGREQATLICPQLNVTYTVQVVPYLVTSAPTGTYFGEATLNTSPGTTCNPNVPVADPPRASGGLVFNTSTVVDLQRQVGEPDIVFSQNGDIYASGPWGTSTNQSYAWKSVDDFTYHTIGRIRPDVGPGGGDTTTETDDQNFVYFTDLEGLLNLAAARSTDGGNTWTRNSIASYETAVDRQWMAIDNGLTGGASDNTQFFTWRQAALGSFVEYSTDGQTFLPAQANPADAINNGAPCGDFIFDPTDRYLYLPCGRANQVEVAWTHVDPEQRTGLVFTSTMAGNAGGETSELFPTLDVDEAGNVYVAYVDTADHNVYLVYSTDHAQTWSDPVRLNGNEARTAVFPWIDAGADGRVAVAYIATDSRGPNNNGDPNDFPSWFNDKIGSTTVKWHLYVNYVTGANTSSPTIYQDRATEHPMNFGQVCTAGTLCIATGGDRTMADFLTLQHDHDGALSIIYNDTTNQHHGASVMEVRQLAGPSIFGSTLSNVAATNPVTDTLDDAQYPHFSPTGPGPNYDALDIEGVGILSDASTITVTMTISDLNATRVLPGATSVLWLTRWQAKALGDYGEESYRIYYAGARSTGGGAPTFFYGSTQAMEGSPVGCTQTTPQTCKLLQYPSVPPLATSTTGTFSPTTGLIEITVPRSGVGDPPVGASLYSITGYTLGTRDTTPDFYDDVDVARAFTVTLATGPAPTATPTVGPSVVPTFTATAVATSTPCGMSFTDVPPSNDFYWHIRCLVCRYIISGYSDHTFRPNNEVTRGQLSKIVANSAGFNEPASGQTYEDVPTNHSFYSFIEKMSARGIMGGYPCGTNVYEPCGEDDKPYFRPGANATRGQISKIVSNAKGYNDPPTGQTFEDVPPGNPFYEWIQRLASRGIMGGYPCGSVGEPCGPGSKPYFRWSNTTTRGQASKIVANTFFPNCETPARR
jgi:hypothetical protein